MSAIDPTVSTLLATLLNKFSCAQRAAPATGVLLEAVAFTAMPNCLAPSAGY